MARNHRITACLIALAVFAMPMATGTLADETILQENWPQWRGPAGTGVAADGDYPIEFSSTDNVAWKVELPGLGSSTPAVWGDQIFVTCGIDGQDGLVCYDFFGHERWRRQFGREDPGKHRNGSGSNPSPVTDGEHLVVLYKSGTVACLDLLGTELWRHNLEDMYGPIELWWDFGTSPVLADDRVMIAVMNARESYVVAFRLADGEVLWKVPRQYERPVESDQAYTTPSIVTVNGRELVVISGSDHLTGHDVATGELVFEDSGFNPDDKRSWRVIASAVTSDGLAVVPYGRGSMLSAVRLDGEGDITGKSHRAWQRERLGAEVPTPVIANGRIYLLRDHGNVTCLGLQTGEDIWTGRVPGNRRSRFYASPVLGGDTLYCTRDDGTIFVGRVGDQYTELAENNMGESIIATPIPIRGGLLIRGTEHLFWIDANRTTAN